MTLEKLKQLTQKKTDMTKLEVLNNLGNKLIEVISCDPGSVAKDCVDFAKQELSRVVQAISNIDKDKGINY